MKASCIILFLALLAIGAQRYPNTPPPAPTPPARPSQSVWQGMQDSIDRSIGRIENEPSYQLDRIQNSYGPQGQFQQFNQERERQLRIDQKNPIQIQDPRQRRAELDRREYDVFLQSGLSTTSLQVMADEQALNQAKAARDQQLLAAEQQRSQALAAHPENRVQIEADYQKQFEQIHQQYDAERGRILGVMPATQPSP